MFRLYREIFVKRGDLYNQATDYCPDARKNERDELLSRLDLEPGLSLCDAPAGGGYVADGIAELYPDELDVICMEPTFSLARRLIKKHRGIIGNMESIPLRNNSVDRVSSLAGLHHLPDKQVFFNETARIMKPGGLIVVADVQAETNPARFLNDSVDRYSETGHEGIFLQAGELSARLRDAGYTGVNEELVTYTWNFPDHESLVFFCKTLFGMTLATLRQVDDEIRSSLNVTVHNNSAHLEWSLIFASGRLR